MRKIFIDGGANKGQSTDKFIENTPSSEDFEIFMIEPLKSCESNIQNVLDKYENYNINYFPNAVWINEGELKITYNSDCTESAGIVFKKKSHHKEHLTKTLHLSKWIKENFDQNDYIILKLDIEGAEYNVVEDLYRTDMLNYINEFHGELHGSKKGFNINDDLMLIERLKKYDLDIHHWNGSNSSKGVTEDGIKGAPYTSEAIESEYKKWESRGNGVVKPEWDKLEQYRNNYKEWYDENME